VSDGPRLAVGAVIVDPRSDGPHVVLARRANPPQQGRWSLPGGRVERGETLERALVREILEECGLTVRVVRLLEVVELIDGDRHHVVLDYECAVVDGILRAGDDAAEVAWVAAYDLAEYDVTPAVARMVSRAIADERE
jgi:8-oxo-dGTP diphosphatase